MPYQATVFTVMIASPSDVPEEREIVRKAVLSWNAAHAKSRSVLLEAVGWETHSHPTMEEPAQTALNKQILDDADLLVAIFGNRIGTPTKDALSGTVEEIQRHIKAGRPVMMYFSDMAMPRDRFDPHQWKRLNDFRADCMAKGLVQTYASHVEFKDKFNQHLPMLMNKWPQALAHRPKANEADPLSWLSATVPDINESLRQRQRDKLSAKARELLLNASVDPQGQVLRASTKDGLEIVTNGRNFVPESHPRDRVEWDAAVDELWMANLLKVIQHKQLYEVTLEGYRMADLLRMDFVR